ncbi:DUF429 domain-containing protein [Schumannella sp. 10F1B-5-1]|uniref:DUF429 domain-containing protein n=1 Tax=Schumannella sp. 10F1B-5-1 TaxID=2590780 RepID=UPI001130764B|nr:DUF429 domain-containing protein [Schumannella sp. 10F1B-5-1]TPW70752.1 DUF429 domain-containing protein [Schumannella sp. 10F1B-5-1]
MPRFFGVDLAWRDSTPDRPANETGLAVIDETGAVLQAGWERGVDAVARWLIASVGPGDVIAIDAPLVVTNALGMRQAERQVASGYGRWQVAANAMNLASPLQGGVALRRLLEAAGVVYVDGSAPPPPDRAVMFECYPYTTIVGMEELGYDEQRPRYKRLDRSLSATEARVVRASAADQLLERMDGLASADPPLRMRTHPVATALLDEPSPLVDAPYKHREDALDALLCAWTAAIWHRHGTARVQVLGADAEPDEQGRRPTIVAPARPMQRVGAAIVDPDVPDASDASGFGALDAPPTGADPGLLGRVVALTVEVRDSDDIRLDPAMRTSLAELAARIVHRLAHDDD